MVGINIWYAVRPSYGPDTREVSTRKYCVIKSIEGVEIEVHALQRLMQLGKANH